MPKYVIRQRTLMYVDWFYEVEAENAEAMAIRVIDEGLGDNVGFVIRDCEPTFDVTSSVITSEDFDYQHRTVEGLKIEQIRRLYEAARVLLTNIFDSSAYGPSDVSSEEEENYIQDDDGDYWFMDVWELNEAVNTIELPE